MEEWPSGQQPSCGRSTTRTDDADSDTAPPTRIRRAFKLDRLGTDRTALVRLTRRPRTAAKEAADKAAAAADKAVTVADSAAVAVTAAARAADTAAADTALPAGGVAVIRVSESGSAVTVEAVASS
jgi:hypothetical protein